MADRDDIVEGALRCVATALAGAVAYLLAVLAAAAASAARRRGPAAPARRRWAVLIPAHDEEALLPATLAAVARLERGRGDVQTVVVADHCRDSTAAVARAAGARTVERHAGPRGKGHALASGIAALTADPPDAVLILDADCEPSPHLLAELEARLDEGAGAVQARYEVANPDASPVAALRHAAFALVNTVRPQGREALGLSCGITGSGFALSWELLARHGWPADSVVEDAEYHVRLVEAGERVRFAPGAAVRSPMPATWETTAAQQARWETGTVLMWRRWAPALLAAGARRRDPRAVATALDGLVPPQAGLAAAGAGLLVAGRLLRARRVTRRATAALAGQVLYVLGGLRVAGAPPAAYRALAWAPVLVARRLALYARLGAGRRPRSWVRTPRDA